MKIKELLKEKQSNIYKHPSITIAFLGDSVTQGCFECYKTGEKSIQTVFDYSSGYPYRLREMLNLLYPMVQVNIINSGISGDNAPNGLSRIDRDILRFNPDLVVVGYALNDCGNGEKGIARYADAVRGILTRIAESGAEAIFLTPNMMNTEVSCQLTDEFFIKLGKEFAESQLGGMLDNYVDAARAVAKELSVPVCDIYSVWKSLYAAGVNVTDLLSNKLNHPVRELHYYTAIKLCELMLS